MNIILVAGIGILIGIVFSVPIFIWIKNRKTPQSKQSGQVTEPFDIKKFFSGFALFNPVAWSKRFVSFFWNVVLYGVIIGAITFYGYTLGNKNQPVNVNLGYGREAIVKINNNEYMHITKSGEVHLQDKADDTKAKTIRVLTVSDLGNLQSKLSPIGFQFRPVAVTGYGLGIGKDGGFDNGIEVGAGVSFFRYWRGSVEAFLTQKGVYVGTSYRLDRIYLSNASIGVAIGKGYRDFINPDIRVMVYGSIKF